MPDWTLTWTGWHPGHEPLREALCTLCNGQIAVRGAFEGARAGGPHYPGTYLAGGYDRAATEIRGRLLVHEDLVNWPNPLPLAFRAAGGGWVDLVDHEVLERRPWTCSRASSSAASWCATRTAARPSSSPVASCACTSPTCWRSAGPWCR